MFKPNSENRVVANSKVAGVGATHRQTAKLITAIMRSEIFGDMMMR